MRGACRILGAFLAAGGCGSGPSVGEAGTAGRRSAPVANPESPPAAPVARVATTTAWLDLLAQRPTATRLRDGRVAVDLSSTAALAHGVLGALGGWVPGADAGGERAGLVRGRAAELELPVAGGLVPIAAAATAESPSLAVAIRWRALVEGQRVTVAFGGRPIAHLAAGTAWEVRTLSVPGDLSRAGDLRLSLFLRKEGLAVSDVQLGPIDRIREGLAAEAAVRFEGGGAAPVRMRVERGGGIAWTLAPPRRSRLALEARGRGRLRVLAATEADQAAGRLPRALLAEPLRPSSTSYDVDLGGLGGEPVWLELRVEGTRPGDHAVVTRAEVIARRAAPVDRRPRAIRDLVVVALEGARADDLLPDGGPAPHPVFERLAREGLVFTRAYATGAWAVPNHAALLSSVPPPFHRTSRGTVVADALVTLPEHLERAGYHSVLATTNPDVNERRGLAQGFDRYVYVQPQTDRSPSSLVLPAALAALERGEAGAPRFLYLVVNDPQPPFDPPRDRIKGLEIPPGAPLPHLTHIWIERVRRKRRVPTAEELRYVRALYRAELTTVGEALAELLDVLERAGRLDDTILVVVGVHGEEFYEHEGAGHGRTLFEETLRVPLFVRAPGLVGAHRVDAPVDLVDLSPTLLDLLGLPLPATFRGVSLLPVADDPVPSPRTAAAYLGDGSRALIGRRYKLVVGPGRRQRLFDLLEDPGEQRDLVAAGRGTVALRWLRAAQAWQDARARRWHRSRWGFGVALSPAFALDEGL